MAARVRATCSQIFRYGIAAGYNKRDIAADLVGALTPHKVRHHAALKLEELPELLRKIRESTEEEPVTRLALLFLANTAVRTSELIGAEWIEFDIKAAVWTVPGARMKMGKEHLVPLSRQVLRLLEELRTINGNSRYVFASPINQDKHISNNTILFALYRTRLPRATNRARLSQFVQHDRQ